MSVEKPTSGEVAEWDVDGVRDDLVGYVREHLANPDAILVAAETGFLGRSAVITDAASHNRGCSIRS